MTESQDNKRQLYGAILVLLSGITLSTKAIFAKLAYRYGVDALSMLALRMFFAMPLLIAMAYQAETRAQVPLRRAELLRLGLLGVLGYYLSSLLDFLGLMHISANLERLVLYLYPTFVLLLSALLFATPLRRTHLMALVLGYAGMAIVLRSEANLAGPHVLKGALLVLGCAVGYAAYLVGAGRLIPVVGATRFNAYALLFATAAIFLHWLGFGHSLRGLPLPVYGYGFLMATLATVIPTWLLTKGIALVGAGPAAILTMVGPVATIALAHWLLREPVTATQILGSTLVLIGVALVTARR